jgi:hypothetical protein
LGHQAQDEKDKEVIYNWNTQRDGVRYKEELNAVLFTVGFPDGWRWCGIITASCLLGGN